MLLIKLGFEELEQKSTEKNSYSLNMTSFSE